MDKFDITRFTDAALKQAGKVYMTSEDIKAKRKQQKVEEDQFKFLKQKGEADIQSQAMNDAMAFHKMQHPEKYAKPGGVEEKGRAGVLAKLDAIYSKDPSTWTPAEKSYVQNMAPYITRRKTDVTGMPGGGGAGAKTQSLSDIQKTYRKDFIHEEAQKWFSNVTKAVESNDWDTFMALGKDIQKLETRISQGIAGTSEVVRSQISSATAFWSTIYEQLTPDLYKIPGAESTVPVVSEGQVTGAGAGVPEGLLEVRAAQDLYYQGEKEGDQDKMDRGQKALNDLIAKYSKDKVNELMR